jgi:hypothetical protein
MVEQLLQNTNEMLQYILALQYLDLNTAWVRKPGSLTHLDFLYFLKKKSGLLVDTIV